ncbi:SMP-30/gluconolactonase/LRE family protein [Paenalcaligenes sp. Me131]|uniref:SMP-30/gluconolactonase/LRE family protein n=1 Tax=Paenalcaligenes sp. Me131 TaxID=3392636 RepID=UPI003D274A20
MSLYPPPAQRCTEVFSRLPECFFLAGTPSGWVQANKPGQAVNSFLEGPSFDREGRLYVVDIPYGRIFRICQKGEWKLISQYDGWPNGLKIHADGRIFLADYQHGILQLDPNDGKITPVLTHRRSEGFKGVNDLIFDQQGNLYFTDQGQTGLHDPTGRVFCYNLDSGRLDCLLDTGISPNGLALSPDEKTLYVAMTRGNAIWRLPLLADGSVSKVGIFVQMAGGVSGADGVAVDQAGNVFVADAGNGCVWSFSQYGEPLHRYIACTGGRTVTNLAFGGKDLRTLYMIDSFSGAILKAQTEHPGLPLFSHSDT